MKKHNRLEAIRSRTPEEVKLFVDHSFAIVDRIDEILNRRSISRRQLAEWLGKQESEVSKWMGGMHNFTLKTLAKLEAVLGEPILTVAGAKTSTRVLNLRKGVPKKKVTSK